MLDLGNYSYSPITKVEDDLGGACISLLIEVSDRLVTGILHHIIQESWLQVERDTVSVMQATAEASRDVVRKR